MSLTYAILGILNIMPMTGYDLKHKAFDSSIRHFWPADQAQIYRSLNTLAEKGWTIVEVETQDERPDRKVYHITETGRAALQKWLTTDQAPPVLRDPFLVQLFLGPELPNEQLLALVKQQYKTHQDRLAAFQQIPIPPRESQPEDRWLGLMHLTLDFGLAFEQTYLHWLEHCRETIQSLPGEGAFTRPVMHADEE